MCNRGSCSLTLGSSFECYFLTPVTHETEPRPRTTGNMSQVSPHMPQDLLVCPAQSSADFGLNQSSPM